MKYKTSNERFSQCLAAKLPLYMLQISPFLQVSLVLTDESFCQYLAAELVVQTKRFFSSSLPLSLIFFVFLLSPFPAFFFSLLLTVTPECKQETPSIYCVFYSASLAFFFSVFGVSFSALFSLFFSYFFALSFLFFCSLFAAPVRSLEGFIYSLNMSLFRKDSMH